MNYIVHILQTVNLSKCYKCLCKSNLPKALLIFWAFFFLNSMCEIFFFLIKVMMDTENTFYVVSNSYEKTRKKVINPSFIF